MIYVPVCLFVEGGSYFTLNLLKSYETLFYGSIAKQRTDMEGLKVTLQRVEDANAMRMRMQVCVGCMYMYICIHTSSCTYAICIYTHTTDPFFPYTSLHRSLSLPSSHELENAKNRHKNNLKNAPHTHQADTADSANMVKALVVKAEDARLLRDMASMKKAYSSLLDVNRCVCVGWLAVVCVS